MCFITWSPQSHLLVVFRFHFSFIRFHLFYHLINFIWCYLIRASIMCILKLSWWRNWCHRSAERLRIISRKGDVSHLSSNVRGSVQTLICELIWSNLWMLIIKSWRITMLGNWVCFTSLKVVITSELLHLLLITDWSHWVPKSCLSRNLRH